MKPTALGALCAGLALSAAVTTAPPAEAAVIIDGHVRATERTGGTNISPVYVSDHVNFHETLVDTSPRGFGAATPTLPGSYSSVVVQAAHGWGRVFGLAQAAKTGTGAPPVSGTWGAGASFEASLQMTDTLTISAPGMSGMTSVRMGFYLDGGLTADIDTDSDQQNVAYGTVFAEYEANGQRASVFLDADADNCAPPACSYTGAQFDSDQVVDHFVGRDVTFTWGTPFDTKILIDLYGYATVDLRENLGYGDSTLISDFYSTLTWAGIGELYDASGNPVTDFTVTSVSGTDYRFAIQAPPTPIPLPSSALLLLSGLAALSTRRRRAARSSH